MSPYWVAAVILLAVLVGTAIPVLLQLRQTLKTLDSVLEKTSKNLDEALDEVTSAARRINDLGKELEEGATRMRLLFEVAGDVGKSLGKVRDVAGTVGAVATSILPAVVAGMRAFFRPEAKDGEGDGDSEAHAVPVNSGNAPGWNEAKEEREP